MNTQQSVNESISQAKILYPDLIQNTNTKTVIEQPSTKTVHPKKDDEPGFFTWVFLIILIVGYLKLHEEEEHIKDGMSDDPRRRAKFEMWLHNKD